MDKIDELLTRGVENIIPGKEELEKVLRSGKKLNIYLGIDPTATSIHLGNAVPLRKLQLMMDLGHHVTFLIGDFTALVGDTSDKDSERPILTAEQIEKNFQTYKKQAEKFLDFSKVEIRHNREWLSKLSFEEVIQLMQQFSLNDFISRELIKKRLTSGGSVRLDEVAYPMMQGYDSYFMDTDIQFGGTDQTFNMQAGRVLQKSLRHKQSFVVANAFLSGTDGNKMSKTKGNAIFVTEEPNEMFGKLMSVNDDVIMQYFTMATNIPLDKVAQKEARLKSGENPMVLKKELAWQIVSELHSKASADQAQGQFESTFQKGRTDLTDMTELTEKRLSGKTIIEVIVSEGLVSSKSEAKRLIDQNAIERDGEVITEDGPATLGVYKIGKKKFLKII